MLKEKTGIKRQFVSWNIFFYLHLLESNQGTIFLRFSSCKQIFLIVRGVVFFQCIAVCESRCLLLQGRKRGEDLNERVMIWSIFVTVAIVFVGIAQVSVVRISMSGS